MHIRQPIWSSEEIRKRPDRQLSIPNPAGRPRHAETSMANQHNLQFQACRRSGVHRRRVEGPGAPSSSSGEEPPRRPWLEATPLKAPFAAPFVRSSAAAGRGRAQPRSGAGSGGHGRTGPATATRGRRRRGHGAGGRVAGAAGSRASGAAASRTKPEPAADASTARCLRDAAWLRAADVCAAMTRAKDRWTSVPLFFVHGERLPLGNFSAGVRIAAVAGATRSN